MALPQDGQNANGLTKVTEIPKGKELIFIDPTTNEGGIITLEDLTTQILNKLTSKIFTLDQGNITLIEALNKLNSNSPIISVCDLDNPPEKMVFKAGIGSKNLPSGLGGINAAMVLQVITGNNNYGAMLVFSFASDKIAIRRKYNSPTWSDWKYFTAQ